MRLEVSQKITIEKTKNSKIDQVDFNNLPFGQVYTDHMLICEYENGKWDLCI
jgi:branched-chain amino acid aminotransferase